MPSGARGLGLLQKPVSRPRIPDTSGVALSPASTITRSNFPSVSAVLVLCDTPCFDDVDGSWRLFMATRCSASLRITRLTLASEAGLKLLPPARRLQVWAGMARRQELSRPLSASWRSLVPEWGLPRGSVTTLVELWGSKDVEEASLLTRKRSTYCFAQIMDFPACRCCSCVVGEVSHAGSAFTS